jgi:hypothetical protein
MNTIVRVPEMTNGEFLERYARAGRIGLVGGATVVDQAIRRAERHVDEQGRWSRWSHAFIFEGKRVDGRHWLLESDIHLARKHWRLGAQENRIDKYFDAATFPALAALDFGLTAAQTRTMLTEGLELVAGRARYSLRELVGTLVALRHPQLRGRRNLLAREGAFYCSALVQHLYRKCGVDLAPALDGKNTTPEDLARTVTPHTTYLLERPAETGRWRRVAARWRRKVRAVTGRHSLLGGRAPD